MDVRHAAALNPRRLVPDGAARRRGLDAAGVCTAVVAEQD
jgi:hypothetical protein